ncbi:MAG: CRISPR-associated endonuclease Cas2 [Bacteroidetes bacterium]|nr:CRISPR-associated endonuclease Cas2 [Bacteroidota bacterium]
MYTLLVYDVDAKRTNKYLKLCRRYLNWIQNSVFEGELTEAQLGCLKAEIKEILEEEDSIIMFHSREAKWLKREVMGQERMDIDNFL